MALVSFPIFDNTVWMLTFYALLACFVGRLHIYLGAFITNCFRSDTTEMRPISGPYAFIMWFSGACAIFPSSFTLCTLCPRGATHTSHRQLAVRRNCPRQIGFMVTSGDPR